MSAGAPSALAALSAVTAASGFPEPADRNESCPRCAAPFYCGAADPRCDCFDLQLSEALRQRLAVQYHRCLCMPCLRALQAAETNAEPSTRLTDAE